MAFTPFVDTDLPSMANFNQKFLDAIQQATDDAVNEAPKIATGSYVGTGTSGSSSRNTLTFSFEPKIVFIQHQTDASFNKNSTSEINYAFMINGITSYVDRLSSSNVSDGIVYVSWEGNTVTWYRDSSSYPDGQLNISGATYHYVAIG